MEFMSKVIELVSGIRTAGVALARSLPGDVGVACLTVDLADAIAEKYNVTTFSVWVSLGKRFDNIVMLYEDIGMDENETVATWKAVENLVTRLSGPDGKVYIVV